MNKSENSENTYEHISANPPAALPSNENSEKSC